MTYDVALTRCSYDLSRERLTSGRLATLVQEAPHIVAATRRLDA